MSFETLQNTPIEIDLLQEGRTTGWTIQGITAVHEVCNAGNIYLIGQDIIAGHTYVFSYKITTISGGQLRANLGGTQGVINTTAGFKTETITAVNSNDLYFYSNANCVVEVFNIKDTIENTSLKQQTSFTWSEKSNKWVSFRTYSAEAGFSLFTNLYTSRNGQLWKHDRSLFPRNNFYGVQYKSIFKFVANGGQGVVKTFESISYESNELLITTTGGITTSLGQISELNEIDFLHEVLSDGINQVNIYDVEGIYSASFVRDKNDDINTGSDLKGTYIVIELVTTTTGMLTLNNVMVNSVTSSIGTR